MSCTALVEVEDEKSGDWRWRGTAFFVGTTTLLTCAHVVAEPRKYRVVAYSPPQGASVAGQLVEQPVRVACRIPKPPSPPQDPYPLPDVAVLRFAGPVAGIPQSTVWLDQTGQIPGNDLYVFGYTDEYVQGEAFGHPVRASFVGWEQVNGRPVGRMSGDRVRQGLSGAPVLDRATGKVVGIVKRSQDTTAALGAYFVPMKQILPVLPARLKLDNEALHSSPVTSEDKARALWGNLVRIAADHLAGNPVALEDLAEDLGLRIGNLPPDEVARVRRVARELFDRDLIEVADLALRHAKRIDADSAGRLFDAVAVCARYLGEPWISAEAAAELAAQVELLAAQREAANGRVVYLRAPDDLRTPYLRRADREGKWSDQPLKCEAFSHVTDDAFDVPADLDRQLRQGIVAKYKGAELVKGLDADELDDAARARWDAIRPKLLARLRSKRTVGFLPPRMTLDQALVRSLVNEYQLLMLAVGPEGPPHFSERLPYQLIDPDVDSTCASEAFLTYLETCNELASQENGGPRR